MEVVDVGWGFWLAVLTLLVSVFCTVAGLVAGLVWLVTRSKPKAAWGFALVTGGLFASFAVLVLQHGMAFY